MSCIYSKIIAGEIPSEKVLETDEIFAFRDINPAAPEHILIVPKKHVPNLEETVDEDSKVLAQMFFAARDIAKKQSLENTGYRLILNNGRSAGQEVFHLHLHLLGGKERLGPMLSD